MTTPSWTGTHGLSAATIATALGLPTPTLAQQEVIEAPPVPALVVAGAGSGKTETMSARVVWLVANGHVQRDEVLGLTFTRKAAGELAERIGVRLAKVDEYARRGLLPHLTEIVATGTLEPSATTFADQLDAFAAQYDTGWDPRRASTAASLMLRPRVSTYNAFADAIVRENAARIGRDTDASMLSGAGAWLLARSVVMRSVDARLAESDTAVRSMISAVQELAGAVLDNRADLDAVAAYGVEFAARLEGWADPTLRSPGDVERAWGAASSLPVIAGLVREYAQAKAAQGVLDFADQVAGALDIMEAAPQVAEDLRTQYRVVLLDEYQDTSVLQTRLLSEIFHDHPVMAVGDPHQSIYGWRGASADNLDQFASAFARTGESGRYSLMISWRNDVDVLTAANALLAPLQKPGRLEVGQLEPRPGAGAGVVEHIWAETLEEEADAVAAWFADVRAAHSGDTAHTGAILFRAKKHMRTFADALDRHGVPNRILGLGGLLSSPEVTDVVSALRVIHDPGAGSALIRLLTGPRFAIGVADMAALQKFAAALTRRDGRGGALEQDLLDRIRASAGVDEQVSIIDALDVLRTIRSDSAMLSDFTEAGYARLRDAAGFFDRLRRAAGRAIPDLLRLIETELLLDVELAANETRGPARVATAQLRAFGDEVRGFLAADERGTVGSLLSWLDHAEDTDELMPRPEPPQPGVVQLLTIHGSKGLEWDATAVVRLVADELPKRPRSTMGWLSLGALPYDFRGDRSALPVLELPDDPAVKKTEVNRAIASFKAAEKAHQEEEERRLAYVAVTRARSRLLLTGSFWSTQTAPRRPSAYLQAMLVALGRDELEGESLSAENPTQDTGRTLTWPMDPLGERRGVVEQAAALVRGSEAAAPSAELERLLREREERARLVRPTPPTRIPASMFKDFVADYDAAVGRFARPLPERPFPQTRVGTDFHAWIEDRYGLSAGGTGVDDELWDDETWELAEAVDGLAQTLGVAEGEAEVALDDELRRLQETFLASEWAQLRPLEIESEIDYTFTPAGGGPAHIMICKLDAVFRREDGRIEIVDWKTGRPPATAAERRQRLLQLAHYRVAYHRARGVPLEDIDIALYYVGHDLVLRPEQHIGEAELGELWTEAETAGA